MDIIISNAAGEPIYEQIVSQIKAQIMSGELKEGDALPSMRALAQGLRISVITTKRAYEELEKDGFIESYTGRGSYVKKQNVEFLKEECLKEIEELLIKACDKAKAVDIDLDEMTSILEMLYGGKDND
ncbi:MAG: GntR family transcriptional regulator [Ruminococcus sp.]|nr:GntR family transcriptional regulator [Ruminococcus sp.]